MMMMVNCAFLKPAHAVSLCSANRANFMYWGAQLRWDFICKYVPNYYKEHYEVGEIGAPLVKR